MSVKKRILSALLALALMFGMVPMTVFAEPCAADVTAILKVVNETAEADGRTVTKPGDTLRAEVYLQGTAENQGLLSVTIVLGYEEKLAEVMSQGPSDALKERRDLFEITNATAPKISMMTEPPTALYTTSCEDFPQPLYLPTDAPMLIYSATLRVVDNLNETGLDGEIAFSFNKVDITVGHCWSSITGTCTQDDGDHDAKVTQNVSAATITVDTNPPEFITLDGHPAHPDGTPDGTYDYQPVKFGVKDNDGGSGIASVTVNGTPVQPDGDGNYGAAADGENIILITDNANNTLRATINISLANFNAAKTAAAKLQEQGVKYSQARTDLAAAQAAMGKLSDNAKAQLADEQTLITQTETKLQGIAAGITAVADKIAALPETTDNLTAENIKAIDQAQKEAQAMFAQGVEAGDITGYNNKLVPLLEKASAELAKIEDARAKLKALSNITKMTFDDKAKIDAAQTAVDAVIEGALTEEDLKPLTDANAAYQKLLDDKAELEGKFNALDPDQVKLSDREKIVDLRAQAQAMISDLHATLDTDALASLKAAEDALKALGQKSQEVHDKIKNLPSKTSYAQKEAIKTLRGEMNNMKDKGDTFTTEEENKVKGAEDAITSIETRLNEAKTAMQALSDPFVFSELDKVEALEQKVAGLLADGVTEAQIQALEGYTKYAKALEASKEAREAIKAAKAKIAALPAAEDAVFGTERALAEAEDAVAALGTKYNYHMDAADEADIKLKAVRAAIEDLKTRKDNLLAELESKPTVSLSDTNKEKIAQLRSEATALNAKGAGITADELKLLTQAETELKALQKQSDDLHSAIAALPAADNVTYSQKTNIADIKARITELTGKGDTFTPDENAKVKAVEDKITELDTLSAGLPARMNALNPSAPVTYAVKTTVDGITNDMAKLSKAGWPAQDNTTEAYQKYAQVLQKANEMQDKLDAVNAEMDEALKSWKYIQDDTENAAAEAAYDTIRTKMDQLAADYGITAGDKAVAFPKFNASKEYRQTVATDLASIKTKIDALPEAEDITKDDKDAVNEVAALVDKLKGSPYNLPDAQLSELLTEEVYNKYKGVKSKLEALLAPPPSRPGDNRDDKDDKSPLRAIPVLAANGQYPRSPMTSSREPVAVRVATAALALLGVCLCIKKRKEQ